MSTPLEAEEKSAETGLPHRLGILCVVSGPSGCGKTTLCRKMSATPECVYSVSCTTRPPRQGEVDGKDYLFLKEEEFTERATRGEFLEHARVHERLYGTLKSWVVDQLEAGIDVVMDIDVQGAELIRHCEDPVVRRSLVDVFILPPEMEELLRRLAGRGTESDAEVALRMRNALDEIRYWDDYQYIITSGSQEQDFDSLASIFAAERQRASRLRPKVIDEVLGTHTGEAKKPPQKKTQPELFGE